MNGVRIEPHEKHRTSVMLIDAHGRVIASSDDQPTGSFRLQTGGKSHGYYSLPDGSTVAFHATPGYETYKGLGWYGVIIRRLS
ncbi:MAG: chemotaxis protein [Oxalobacteraceae bacterium]|nr:MAG: chemotaxis protein [Oxalobacteraceae bacterium]